MLKLCYGTPFPQPWFERLLDLDGRIYGEDIFTTPGNAEARHAACPDCFVWMEDGDRLAGAWSVYPVTADFWRKARESAVLLDDNVGPEHICPLSLDGCNYLMNFDLVVDPDYRGHGISDQLMKGFRQYIRDRRAEGYRFGTLIGFVITEGGIHSMLKYGAKLLQPLKDHFGYVYEIDLNAFSDWEGESI